MPIATRFRDPRFVSCRVDPIKGFIRRVANQSYMGGAVDHTPNDILNCQKKTRYLVKRHTKKPILAVKQEHGIKLYSYKCRVCEAFHLTRTNPSTYEMEFENTRLRLMALLPEN